MKSFYTRSGKIGGKVTQQRRDADVRAKRAKELKELALQHDGFASLALYDDELTIIQSGTLEGKKFFTDTKPEAIFADGTIIGGNPWFLD